MSYPYLAKTLLKYKSPHATDLSFAKDETIRVTGPSDDDEDWLVGETLDGSKSGGFPKDFIEAIDNGQGDEPADTPAAISQSAVKTEPIANDAPPVPTNVPAPPSPKLDSASLPPSTAQSPAPAAPTIPLQSSAPPAAAPPAPATADTVSAQVADDSPQKPQSMKDRLAFFAAAQNKAAASPPPLKPKPATGGLTWSQRQKLRQEQEAKDREAAEDAAPATSGGSAPATTAGPAAAVPSTEETSKEEGKGMSAADALSSISKGGSLKDRMAALQGSRAFGGSSGNDESEKPPPAATGKVWKRPPAPEPEPEMGSAETAGVHGEDKGDEPASVTHNVASSSTEAEDGSQNAAVVGQEGAGDEEEDEEEKEKARRAAIAARMAKLGARGPMGMMPPAKPARKPTKEAATDAPALDPSSEDKAPSAATAEGDGDIQPAAATVAPVPVPGPSSVTSPSAPDVSPASAAPLPKSVPIAAIPRRAAPPRRRGPTGTGSSPAPAASPPSAENVSAEAAQRGDIEPEKRFERFDEDGKASPPPQVMVAGEEEPLPKTQSQLDQEAEDEERGKGPGGLEGAAAAGIALASVEKTAVEENASSAQPDEDQDLPEDASNDEPHHLVGAVGDADSDERAHGTVLGEHAAIGEIIDRSAPPHEIEDGVLEGGDEKDDLMREAQEGQLELDDEAPTPLSPEPIGMVPLHPPASEGSDYDEDEPPPPPPRRRMSLDVPLDELEKKHEQEQAHPVDRTSHPAFDEAQEDEAEDDEEDIPPPPPARISTDRPLGPRPIPSPGQGTGRALPPPPMGNPLIPPRDEEEEEREIEQEGDAEDDDAPPLPPARQIPSSDLEEEDEDDDAPPPPPPARQPSLPPPLQMGAPLMGGGLRSPTSPRVTSSPVATSPVTTTSQLRSPIEDRAPAPSEEDEDATRRSGIAARMAKLGGIKFGMPPPVFRKPSANVTSPTAEAAPPARQERDPDPPTSPSTNQAPLASPQAEKREQEIAPPAPLPAVPAQEGEETPEQEAARRRATLARLRAGGALGFGMFNHSKNEEQHEDARGLEAEPQVEAEPVIGEHDVLSSPIDARAPLPPARPMPTPGVAGAGDDQDRDDAAPPPPPPGRPSLNIGGLGANDNGQMQQSPIATSPSGPVRTPSGRRPPVPLEKRFSQSHQRSMSTASARTIPEHGPVSEEWKTTEDPAAIEPDQDLDGEAPPPPPPPGRPPPPPEAAPRRSMSIASRISASGSSSNIRQSLDTAPPTPSKAPTSPRHQSSYSAVPPSPIRQQSMGQSQAQGAVAPPHVQRPGFDALKEASATHGAQLVRAAQGMFGQGKKAYFGDGSPAGFVLVAMDNARIPRPASEWGQVVFEQEAGSILRRYDDPRPGDVAAFHDAKLKGKKGLSTYNQHVGSVEEPLVGIVAEFEDRKHKMRVLQVERGSPEEISYRCEDLKSGKIVVYRPGL
ncbi:hypothetical protein IAU60_003449 [Kwoniella sp. DSM 27419]